ncbi:hypothetical protein CEUSTIGMA_g10078.t1 [Chlamydomonas eustigma]|uniref:Dethiobiotin synthase n=1 Tax=Chlamydomonas eustigma TaxID=1157962 RepID=A0A250XIB2_9CHLO|nr:hypothetical protein CEUSTIGMA_g10078.t1 [Chlamydomonas eustigma]|eukprot:GAX82652.1 hypothetical protein CEUSTIGMA_g10078.t1 [Chlamydomonas eustigma]
MIGILVSLGRSRLQQFQCTQVQLYCSQICNLSQTSNERTVPLSYPIFCIWGANTGIGKSLSSVGLAAACSRNQVPLLYLKPIQTGYPEDSDARLVALASGFTEQTGSHASELKQQNLAFKIGSGVLENQTNAESHNDSSNSTVKVMYAWSNPVSPHLAVQMEGRHVSDSELITGLFSEISAFTHRLQLRQQQDSQHQDSTGVSAFGLIETAGGVASPAPSGSLQCDVLRPFRLPCVLVGDPRLGGISATISAYESLTLRGYDVDLIVFMDGKRDQQLLRDGSSAAGEDQMPPLGVNAAAVKEHMDRTIHRMGSIAHVVSIPNCQPAPTHMDKDNKAMCLDPYLSAWLEDTSSIFDRMLKMLTQKHAARLSRLRALSETATNQLWWPFTQHSSVEEGSVEVIDSRSGDQWQVFRTGNTKLQTQSKASSKSCIDVVPRCNDHLTSLYDGCSSWWTQAVPAHLQSEVAQAVSYAAGRYMHVMHPENAHEPAVALASKLLSTVGKGWASRVFYSDDGSTAIEVALKMAFRKFLHDKGWAADGTVASKELQVLGLENAYHGDTLGAMDCVAPSVYNGRLQAPWYRGRGVFLKPPYVAVVKGRWKLTGIPDWLIGAASSDVQDVSWASLEEVTSQSRDGSPLFEAYRSHVNTMISIHKASGDCLAAAIIEPLVQGAGGMLMIDPQFQKAMIHVCKANGIPVIFDEVFTGLYRLGALSAAQILREAPDIACYAKLLTAGAVPMAATLSTSDVFDAFSGPTKLQALLHGHSYSAYPIGCAAALASFDALTSPKLNPNLCAPPPCDWKPNKGIQHKECSEYVQVSDELVYPSCTCKKSAFLGVDKCTEPCGYMLPQWDEMEVMNVSHHPLVSRAVVIGTILAVELAESSQSGLPAYATKGLAVQIARVLRGSFNIYCRPLGPVVYLMVLPSTNRRQCKSMLESLHTVLDQISCSNPGYDGLNKDGVIV